MTVGHVAHARSWCLGVVADHEVRKVRLRNLLRPVLQHACYADSRVLSYERAVVIEHPQLVPGDATPNGGAVA